MNQPNGYFKCKRINSKNAYENLDVPVSYLPSRFGIHGLTGTGKGIKVCIIDTGFPEHHDIKVELSRVVNFTDSSHAAKDIHGHSTAVAGLICSDNSSGVRGIAPDATVFYAKALSDKGQGDFGAVIASVLWSVVQEVDIIVMAFGSEFCQPTLHDAIRKAYESDIALFAASGSSLMHTKDADYPARFPEVMLAGVSSDSKAERVTMIKDGEAGLIFPNDALMTTTLNDRYAVLNGTSAMAPIAAGLGALVLENMRRQGKPPSSPSELYAEIIAMVNR